MLKEIKRADTYFYMKISIQGIVRHSVFDPCYFVENRITRNICNTD